MTRFEKTAQGLVVDLSPAERMFLGDVLPLLAGVGSAETDPAAERLTVPVYLDDPDANAEWWRLMGQDLQAGRREDRAIFERVVGSEGPTVVSLEEGEAMLRVLNEARLVLGARLKIEVEEDHDVLSEDSRQPLDYLGWIQEDLIVELTQAL